MTNNTNQNIKDSISALISNIKSIEGYIDAISVENELLQSETVSDVTNNKINSSTPTYTRSHVALHVLPCVLNQISINHTFNSNDFSRNNINTAVALSFKIADRFVESI
jgi:hypothetical protein